LNDAAALFAFLILERARCCVREERAAVHACVDARDVKINHHHPSEKSDAAILGTGTRTKNSSAEEEERKEQNDPGRRFAI